MSLHLGYMWFSTPSHMPPAVGPPRWQISTFPLLTNLTESGPRLSHPPRKWPDLYIWWISAMVQSPPRGFWSRTFGWCLIWKICHNMWSTVETKMPLGVRILPFRLYWLKERWSEETIRGIGEGRRVQPGKGCAEDLFSHYATYTERRVWVSATRDAVIWSEFADGEIRWFGLNFSPRCCCYCCYFCGAASASAPAHMTAHHWWVWLCHNEHKETQLWRAYTNKHAVFLWCQLASRWPGSADWHLGSEYSKKGLIHTALLITSFPSRCPSCATALCALAFGAHQTPAR